MKSESIRYKKIDDNSEYVCSKFLYYLNSDQIYLAYDTLNTKLFKITKDDFYALKKTDIKNIIENDPAKAKLLFDNQLLYEKIFDQKNYMNYKINSLLYDNTLEITILPTNACDFRCKYCFQNHGSDYMSEDIEKRIIKHLKRQIPKYKCVYICWFGGEPLLQKQCIYNIMQSALDVGRKCGVPIYGQITTNGYSLDLETFEKLNSYNIIYYHVTIDGPENVHDNLRPHVSGKGTYKTIINNLKNIKEHSKFKHFSMIIRTNTDKQNYTKYIEFLKEVDPTFNNDKRFIFMCQKINDWGGESVKRFNDVMFDNEKQLWDELVPQIGNYNTSVKQAKSLSAVTSCSMKAKNSYAFYCDGSVYKCSMAIDGLSAENDFGKVGELMDNGSLKIDEKKLSQFSMPPILMNKCENCCWLPHCIIGMCPYAVARKDRLRCIVEEYGLAFYDKDLWDDYYTNKFIDLT